MRSWGVLPRPILTGPIHLDAASGSGSFAASSFADTRPAEAPMRHWILLLALIGFPARPGAAFDGEDYHNDPLATYQRRQVQGFTVLISHRVAEHAEAGAASIKELVHQLEEIARVVPPRPLAELRKVRIWLEWHETNGLGELHPGIQPLVDRKRNPAKARNVEIVNAQHLVAWVEIQPWAVLHELAHAYHFIVLGETNAGVGNAYDQAMKSRKYEHVFYFLGGNPPAYAKKDRGEYFAELSEAYFGKNDFGPVDRAELRDFDPVGYQLMVDVWGLPIEAAPASNSGPGRAAPPPR